jgi:hypothetical protein
LPGSSPPVPANGRLDRIRLLAIRANGHPTLAAYRPDDGRWGCRGYGIMVLAVTGEQIAAITGFPDPGLFPLFDLPPPPLTVPYAAPAGQLGPDADSSPAGDQRVGERGVGIAECAGKPVSFWGFTKYGLIVTLVTVALTVPYLWLRYFALA